MEAEMSESQKFNWKRKEKYKLKMNQILQQLQQLK
jgi:hypothetical protein